MTSKSALFSALFTGLTLVSTSSAADFPKFEAQEIDKHAGEVVYAVTTADVNGDKKPDVVAVTEDAVYWYENPSWTKHTITKGKTERDNVCIQPHDIDADGQIDFALGAGWKPSDTNKASTLQWLGRDDKGEWQIHPIKYEQPTLHRIRWGDVLGNGKKQLVVAPLQGKGTKGPNWGEGAGVKVQVFSIPKDPTWPDWPSEVISPLLHTTHNLQVVDYDGDGDDDVVLASKEELAFVERKPGVHDNKPISLWYSRAIYPITDAQKKQFPGASEIKVGRLKNDDRYIATIEPWHGNQVVVYTPDPSTAAPQLFDRNVLAEPVSWGHAVWCVDLDGDGDDEIVIGQRDANKDDSKGPKGPGVFVFDPSRDSKGKLTFTRHTIDDGGMACEDALATDLDGDGKPEIIAGGRATHNVKIYWNKGVTK